ncbi:PstS family phosphate ABC transporter substrate-binding protein [Orenia marismortui]|uniref:PstS family phosphate ABC transporter substrate-binding protein n=1 Tax=Orenia marismortui TaxID=46469 RepID=UPI000376CE07|nr:PstS family phosphate ABC transporter substrate-binding protein [Orenia marismortui]
MFKNKTIALSLVLLLAVSVLFTVTGKVNAWWIFGGDDKKDEKAYIQIKGSDTIVNLAQTLAENYMGDNPNVSISVTGGGSGTGIKALINGTVDIADASRVMKDKEIKMAENNGIDVYRIVLAMDGLSVVTNDNNPVKNLSIEDLGAIFRGEITNWKEVGGPDMPITLYGRQNSSGTFVYFRDNVLKGEYSASMNRMNGNAQIVEAVKADKSAIGYVGIGYAAKDGKAVAGLNVMNVNGATPLDPKNVKNGSYPLARPLNQYINGKPSGAILKFLKYELSEKGEALAIEEGFYPVTPEFQKVNKENIN